MDSNNLSRLGSFLPKKSNDISGLYEVEIAAILILSAIFFLLFLISLGVSTGSANNNSLGVFFRAFCTGTIVAIASASIGSILGFLFGIPKLLQKNGDQNKEPSPSDGRSLNRTGQLFITNTSLEEISDWLTKIIIGLGLVQFQTIVHYVYTASVISASYVEAKDVKLDGLVESPVSGSLAVSFFFALIVSSLLGSCLFIYLETRTRLTLMFLKVESTTSGKAFQEALDRPVANDEDAPLGRRTSSPSELEPLTPMDKELVNVPREQLKSATEIAGWAVAQARAGNTQAGEDALRDALQREPNNIDVMLRLAELRRYRGNQAGFVDAVIELIKKPGSNRSDVRAVARKAQLEALYLPPPSGFDKSIEISAFLESSGSNKQPIIQLRRACAFGLKYRHLNNRESSEAGTARSEALAAAKKVVELVPGKDDPVRVTLRQVYDPQRFGGYATENDLEVFNGDADFEKVIVGGIIS